MPEIATIVGADARASASASTTPCSSSPGTARTSMPGMPVPEAIGRANATAGLSVLFAGTTVLLAIAGLQVSGVPMMTDDGLGVRAHGRGHHARLDHPAAGPARHRRHARSTACACRSSGSTPADNPRSASARWAARSSPRPSATALSAAVVLGVLAAPGVRHAPRLPRRRQRRTDLDHPQGLRPRGRRLRSRHQRPVLGRRREPTGTDDGDLAHA